MIPASNEAQTLTWLLNNFVEEAPGALHAVVVSSDGLLLTGSDDVTVEHAQQLAVVASGVSSLAQTSSRLFGQGECVHTIVSMERAYLLIMAISDGSCLTVLASSDCDMKVIAFQMTLLVENAGHVLTPQLRKELRAALTS